MEAQACQTKRRGSDTRSDIESAPTVRARPKKLLNIRERQVGAQTALGSVQIRREGAGAVAETVGIRIALCPDVPLLFTKMITPSDKMATMAALDEPVARNRSGRRM